MTLSPVMGDANLRPEFDQELQAIADFVIDPPTFTDDAYRTAYHCLLDSLACAFMAQSFESCQRLLGPVVDGESIELGVRVPGTGLELNPVWAAFNIGTLIRYLDFNDTWLAAEWGHPSDNFGAILAVADYAARFQNKHQERVMTMYDVLTAAIKAYEIQGVIALENSFNRQGLDHVILVKLASTAVVTHMIGGDRDQILNALSLAMVDGQALRTYRHAPNTGTRKSWAAGDATSRAVWLAQLALRGEMGYPSALSAPTWGFYDVMMDGKKWTFPRDYGCYVMENILFKIAFPAEFHGQTAVEAAIRLHPEVKGRIDEIKTIVIHTQESAMRIINKLGALHNPADRDHSLQYMVAIALLLGDLVPEDYLDERASDKRIDVLREKMVVRENPEFSRDYLDPDKRAIGNAIQIEFVDGSKTEEIRIDYPIGHRQRRAEGVPLLERKFQDSVIKHFPDQQVRAIFPLCSDYEQLINTKVNEFMDLFVL